VAGAQRRSALNFEVLGRRLAPVRNLLVFDHLPLTESLSPARSTAEMWTNTSLPPVSMSKRKRGIGDAQLAVPTNIRTVQTRDTGTRLLRSK
jgi:hypothetical protein